MKQIFTLCILLAIFAGLSGCNLPTPIPSTNTTPQSPGIPTPVDTPTQPAGITPTYPPVDTPAATGTGTQAVTPPPPPTITPIPNTPTVSPAAETPMPTDIITLDILKNFTYTLEDSPTPITLQNGQYSGDHINSRLIEPAAFGDLNGDGLADAAVVLATNTGGSGTFYTLIPVLNQGGAPVQSGFSPFGDRSVVKNLQIANGRVVLDYLTQGPNDALCCPSEHRLRSYVLDGGKLRLASEQVLDSPDAQATPLPDAIFIDQPADAAKITSPMQVSGRVSQVPPEKKLAYYVTNHQGTLMAQGEVPLEGEVGGPGTFSFEFTLDSIPVDIYKLEVVDSANGILRGRSAVELVTMP